MSELLSELYQEVIIDHGRSPRNRKKLSRFTHMLEGFNPLCGDKVTVYLNVQDSVVKELAFEGAGCAISMASASLMTESLKGKTLAETKRVFKAFHHLITKGREALNADEAASLDDRLMILGNVQNYPMRVKCATLAWHAMDGALQKEQQVVSTE